MVDERKPLFLAEQLNDLDDDEVVEGYQDGLDGETGAGDNRSLSYWHGWRNGMVDGGHAEKDIYQAMLAKSVAAAKRVEAIIKDKCNGN